MTLPTLRRILNDTPGTATDIDFDFQTLQTYVNTEVVLRDGSVAMTAPLAGVAAVNPNEYATLAQAQALIPPGVSWEYGGATAPAGWVLEDGSSYSSTDPTYAALFAVIGYTYGDAGGGNFKVPDSRARVTIGAGQLDGAGTVYARGDTGGQADAELLQHGHTINHGHGDNFATSTTGSTHTHTGTTSTDTHTHNSQGLGYLYRDVTYANNQSVVTPPDDGGPYAVNFHVDTEADDHNHSFTTTTTGSTHTHSVTGSVTAHSGSSGDTGAGTTLVGKNMQPYVVKNKIMKL